MSYKVFIAATGAAKPIGLNVEGADAEGVTSAMDFLKSIKRGEAKSLSGNVAVIGGGSVALDAARSAIRLGADKVSVVCLERLEAGLKDSMLALSEEIEDAVSEGVNIYPSKGVDSFVVKNNRVSSIKCVECFSVRDEDGRFNPQYGDCVLPLEIDAGTVILAIGQVADATIVPEGFPVNERGYIEADKETNEVAPGMFAAGDAVSGPSTVVEALAAGKRAAVTADLYLRGKEISADLFVEPAVFSVESSENITRSERVNRSRMSGEERKNSFMDTVLPFKPEAVRRESERCLTCGSRPVITYVADCQQCNLCSVYCPVDAVTVDPEKCFPPMLGWG